MASQIEAMTMGLLEGRNCVITGASRNLGAEIARRFWLEDASLLLIARSEAALVDLASSLPSRGMQQVFVFQCDLSDPAVPELVAKEIAERFGNFQVLVNNAAVQGPVGPSWNNDGAEWEETIRVNFLTPAALCRNCVPLMERSIHCKIINISGGGATSARPNFSAYAAAKAGLVRFSECLAAETREMGIDVNCVAPGGMPTAMTEAILKAGAERAGANEYQDALRVRNQSASKISVAVELCLFLASAPSDGITGKLISAVWDPWSKLPEHTADLSKSDIYTLRRIVPRDRGYDWGD